MSERPLSDRESMALLSREYRDYKYDFAVLLRSAMRELGWAKSSMGYALVDNDLPERVDTFLRKIGESPADIQPPWFPMSCAWKDGTPLFGHFENGDLPMRWVMHDAHGSLFVGEWRDCLKGTPHPLHNPLGWRPLDLTRYNPDGTIRF